MYELFIFVLGTLAGAIGFYIFLDPPECKHEWSKWEPTSMNGAYGYANTIQARRCGLCGLSVVARVEVPPSR